jgi:hypothetical protein
MEGIDPTLTQGNDDFLIEMADQCRHEGFVQGMQKGLREGIQLAMELRFGDISLKMKQQVERICDVDKLEMVKNALLHVRNPDELKDMIGNL